MDSIDNTGPACRFDPDSTRTWLTSPTPDGDTIAQSLGIVDDFDVYGFERWTRISRLLDAAQTAGVFGVTDHSVAVLHLAGERGFVNAHRITLTTPGQETLCSDEIDTVELLTEHLSGVDAAVHLLSHAAHTTTTLIAQAAPLRPNQPATPGPSRLPVTPAPGHHQAAPSPARTNGQRAAKAFRPLAVDPNAAPATTVHTSTPTGRRRGRST